MSVPMDFAYRGYLVRHSTMRDETWIERDGFLISYASGTSAWAREEEAKRIINELVGFTPATHSGPR